MAAVIAGIEGYFFYRYWQNGALFHFWLHLLLGGYVSLTLLTLRRLRRGRPPLAGRLLPWQAGFLGHLYSALPDVLFLAVGLLHAVWMDVFALHITAHFLWPNALLAGLLLWTLAVAGYVATTLDNGRVATGAFALSAVMLLVAVALRAPVPSSLLEVRQQQTAMASLRQQLGSADWLCSVAATTAPSPAQAVRSSAQPRLHEQRH